MDQSKTGQAQPARIVEKKVWRSFDTRWHSDNIITVRVVQLPPGTALSDVDAVPHYKDNTDHQPLARFYGYTVPVDGPAIYLAVEHMSDEMLAELGLSREQPVPTFADIEDMVQTCVASQEQRVTLLSAVKRLLEQQSVGTGTQPAPTTRRLVNRGLGKPSATLNEFTSALKARCEKEGSVMVRLRDGSWREIELIDRSHLREDRQHLVFRDAAHYWAGNGAYEPGFAHHTDRREDELYILAMVD